MTKPTRVPIALIALTIALLTALPANALSKKETEQAGATLFRDKGCAYCHGATLQGTPKAPSVANLRKTWKAPQIADQIENGGQKMPAFKDSLTGGEIAQLVAFLRAKHRPAPAPAAPSTNSSPVSNPGQ